MSASRITGFLAALAAIMLPIAGAGQAQEVGEGQQNPDVWEPMNLRVQAVLSGPWVITPRSQDPNLPAIDRACAQDLTPSFSTFADEARQVARAYPATAQAKGDLVWLWGNPTVSVISGALAFEVDKYTQMAFLQRGNSFGVRMARANEVWDETKGTWRNEARSQVDVRSARVRIASLSDGRISASLDFPLDPNGERIPFVTQHFTRCGDLRQDLAKVP